MPAQSKPTSDQVAKFEGNAATVNERISCPEAELIAYVDRLCTTAEKLAASGEVHGLERAGVRGPAVFLRSDFDALLQILKRQDLSPEMTEQEILVQEFVLIRNVLHFACDISSQTLVTPVVQRVAQKRADKARQQRGAEATRARFALEKDRRWNAIRKIYEETRPDLRTGGYIKRILENTYGIKVSEKTVRDDLAKVGLPTARKKPG